MASRCVLGCFHKKLTACRYHALLLDTEEMLNVITKRFTAWVESLGKERARSVEQFAWLHADTLDGNSIDTIILLIDAGCRPSMQYFCRCHMLGDPRQNEYFELPPFPFTVTLGVGPSRLGHGLQSLRLETSDEVGMDLLSKCSAWQLLPLASSMRCDSPDLLRFDILGNDSEFVEPERRERTSGTSAAPSLPDVFFLGAPSDFGASNADRPQSRSYVHAGGAGLSIRELFGGHTRRPLQRHRR